MSLEVYSSGFQPLVMGKVPGESLLRRSLQLRLFPQPFQARTTSKETFYKCLQTRIIHTQLLKNFQVF